MRVVPFFICLCFLLLKGNSCVHACIHPSEVGYASQGQMEQTEVYHVARSGGREQIITQTAPDSEKQYLISDDSEFEDEDTSDSFSEKRSLPAHRHSLVSLYTTYPPVSNCPSHYFKAPPFLFGKVAPKYILQGVLRI